MRDDPETLELGRQGARAVVPRWMTLSTLCFAVLIAQLDTSVVNLGTKPIGAYFQASVPALQWVVDAYNLVYACCCSRAGCWPTCAAGAWCSWRAWACSPVPRC